MASPPCLAVSWLCMVVPATLLVALLWGEEGRDFCKASDGFKLYKLCYSFYVQAASLRNIFNSKKISQCSDKSASYKPKLLAFAVTLL